MNLRLSIILSIKLSTIKLSTIKLSTMKLSTMKLSTMKLSTMKLSTMKLLTMKYCLVSLVLLTSCAGLDDMLEIPLWEVPGVLFDIDLESSPGDNMVLVGIRDSRIYDGLQSIELSFFIRNGNQHLAIRHTHAEAVSNFLTFTKIEPTKAVELRRFFPELQDLEVFGIFLQKMSLQLDQLERYETVGDGTYKNVSLRNTQMVDARKLIFISLEVGADRSRYYDALVSNTYFLQL